MRSPWVSDRRATNPHRIISLNFCLLLIYYPLPIQSIHQPTPKVEVNQIKNENLSRPALLSNQRLNIEFEFCESIRANKIKLTDWEIIHTSDEFSLWRRRIEGKTSYEYIAKGSFEDVSVSVYNFTMNDISFRQRWDQNIAEVRAIDSYIISDQNESLTFPPTTPFTPNKSEISMHPRNNSNTLNTITVDPLDIKNRSFVKHNRVNTNSLTSVIDLKDHKSFFSIRNIPSLYQDIYQLLQPSTTYKPIHKHNQLNTDVQGQVNKPPNDSSTKLRPPNKWRIEEIIYWAFKLPWPLQGRDFVYIRRIEFFPGENAILSVQEAMSHPECPEYKKYLRIEEYKSTLSLYPTNPSKNIHEDGLEYILYHYDDSRVPLPDWVTTYVTATIIPNTMKALYEATKKFGPEIKELVETNLRNNTDDVQVQEPQQPSGSSSLTDFPDPNTSTFKRKRSYDVIKENLKNNNHMYLSSNRNKFSKKHSLKSSLLSRDNLLLPGPLINLPKSCHNLDTIWCGSTPELQILDSNNTRFNNDPVPQNQIPSNNYLFMFDESCPTQGQHFYTPFRWMTYKAVNRKNQ